MSQPDERGTLWNLVQSLLSGVRFGQFLSVGIVGLLFDNAALFVLHGLLEIPLWIAKVGSAETAIVVMFLVNENWTFSRWGESSPGELVKRFLKSNLVRVGGVAIAWAVLLVLNGEFGVWYPIANNVGIGVAFLFNYASESLVTWRVHENE
ncbi:GtrA family protein [Haladaptatus sp. GCM10025707]|uniref:GtrA family protein n=1 Tax=unclassified Haladaptatus TaxID=2622732 RepID=UPI0023E8D1F4|nr:GtrA family protein [Haladaptatus sp. QDMS2]